MNFTLRCWVTVKWVQLVGITFQSNISMKCWNIKFCFYNTVSNRNLQCNKIDINILKKSINSFLFLIFFFTFQPLAVQNVVIKRMELYPIRLLNSWYNHIYLFYFSGGYSRWESFYNNEKFNSINLPQQSDKFYFETILHE